MQSEWEHSTAALIASSRNVTPSVLQLYRPHYLIDDFDFNLPLGIQFQSQSPADTFLMAIQPQHLQMLVVYSSDINISEESIRRRPYLKLGL